MKPLHSCASWLLGSVVWLSPALAEFKTPIVIVNARIVPAPGTVIENGSILIDEGRIRAVGEQIDIPVDARRIDASGLTVYPGFIDADTHAGITRQEPSASERALVEDEVPDVREGPQSATMRAYRKLMHPSWRAEELYDPGAAKLDDFRKAGFTAAMVSPAPAIFSGSSALIQLDGGPVRRGLIKPTVAQHAAFVTTMPRDRRRRGDPFQGPLEYPITLIGAMAAFRQIMHDAQWNSALGDWCGRNPGGERSPLDRDLEVLLPLVDGRQPVVFLANTENEIIRALDMAAEFRLRPIIAGAREGWKVADRLREERVPVILSLKWSKEPERYRNEKQGDRTPKEPPLEEPSERKSVFDEEWEMRPFEPQRLFEERTRLWLEEVNNAKALNEAGVAFGLGSFEMESPEDLIENLREAIKGGLPEDVAIAALTQATATALGADDALGAIAAGRLANLTLMTSNVADEKSKVRWVFIEGKQFDPLAVAEKPDRGDRRSRTGRPRGSAQESPDEPVASQATSQPASRPTSQPVEFPRFACESEADRKPTLQTGGNVLLKNATLLTISHGDLPQADILVRDGRIAALGKDIAAPDDVKTLDLGGYYIMPGIIDPHSHICSDGGLNEGSLSVTPEVRVKDAVDHTDVTAYRALAGGVTTIHTMHGSANTIGGQNVVLRLKYGRPASEWLFEESPQTVKFALGENVKQSNFGRRGTRFPNSRMGVEATIRRSFDAALEYKAEWQRYDDDKAFGKDARPPRLDLRLAALAAICDGEIWVHSHCYRADEILRLLDFSEEYGFRVAVLQHVLEGYRVIPEMRRHGCGASTFSDWWGYKLEAYDAIPHNAALMTMGGVVATVNSDSAELMRHLNLEAAKSLRYGDLGANEALRLCTLNAALQLGVAGQVGSIETGKRADLAVFDGHPLDTFSRCVLTLIDGEVFFQDKAFGVSSPPPARPGKRFALPRPPMPITSSPNGEYWIVGGSVHPVSAPTIERGLLVIAGGVIARVGPATDQSPPPGAVVVDAGGLHVYPGLINAQTELGLSEIGSVAGSVDQADIGDLQPDLSALSAYNPFASAIEVARCEGVTAGLLVPQGGVIAGRAGLVLLDGWSMPEARVVDDVALVVTLPSLPVRFPEELPEERQREQIAEHRSKLAAAEEFFRTARHYAAVKEQTAGDDAHQPTPDRRLDAMAPYMRGERPVLFRADSYKRIVEALRFAERYGLRPIILGGAEAWKLADELARHKVDVVLGPTTTYPSDRFEPFDSVYRNPAALHRANVRFCITSPSATLAKNLGIEAGYAVAYGLDEARAIQAITLDAARILGVDDKLGSLDAGKVANVIIATDSPLQASSRIVAEFIAGRPIELASKHTRLNEQFRARPAPSLPPEPVLRGPPALRRTVGTGGD